MDTGTAGREYAAEVSLSLAAAGYPHYLAKFLDWACPLPTAGRLLGTALLADR